MIFKRAGIWLRDIDSIHPARFALGPGNRAIACATTV
jgi:hypothetical protein